MKPHVHAGKRVARYLPASVLYVVFCWPGSSLAQTDSTAVAAIREDIERLERDLTGCENQTAEFARLFSFFPPPLTWVDGVEPTGSLSYHHHNRTRGE